MICLWSYDQNVAPIDPSTYIYNTPDDLTIISKNMNSKDTIEGTGGT